MLHSTPNPVTQRKTSQTPARPVCRQLSFSLPDDDDTSGDTPPTHIATPAGAQVCLEEDKEEEDFPNSTLG